MKKWGEHWERIGRKSSSKQWESHWFLFSEQPSSFQLMLPNKHKPTRWWIRKSNRLYSNKCKNTLNSRIKSSHNLNFAKMKINPRRKAQDELSIYERQRQRIERKKNEMHSGIQALVLQAKDQEASQRRALE